MKYFSTIFTSHHGVFIELKYGLVVVNNIKKHLLGLSQVKILIISALTLLVQAEMCAASIFDVLRPCNLQVFLIISLHAIYGWLSIPHDQYNT